MRHPSLFLSITALMVSAFFFAPFTTHAALYLPGETLDPACAPTALNCGIAALTASSTANSIPYYAANGSILSATSTFTILSNGNIGIGTTSPFAQFSIAGSSGSLTNLFAISTSTALFATTTALVINRNGDVSLGNGANLTVSGNLSISGSSTFTTAPVLSSIAVPAGTLLATDASGNIIATTTPNFGTVLTSTAIGQLPFYNGIGTTLSATSSIFLAVSGNVGIGTTNPQYKLEINGTASSTSLILGTALSTLYGGTGQTSFTAGNLLYGAGTGAIQNVGTTTPTLGLGLAYSGTLGSFVGGVAGSLTIATSSLYSGSAGQLPYFSGINILSATSTFTILSNGNIGIGTTSPFAQFSIAGSSGGSTNLFAISTSTAAFATTTALVINRNGDVSLGNGANLSVSGNTTHTGALTQTGVATFASAPRLSSLATPAGTFLAADASGNIIATSSPNSGTILTSTAIGQLPFYNGIGTTLSATSSIFLAASGYVGISTSTPAYNLDVYGSIRASSQLRADVVTGTAPLAVNSVTKVANLNADLLDGFDSSAFGDATVANQTTMLTRIGTAADAANMDTTLFAGQQYIWDNKGSFGSVPKRDCTSSDAVGTICSGGMKFATGLVAMPGGCALTNINPICNGTTDSVTKAWSAATGSDEPANSTTNGWSNTGNLVYNTLQTNAAAQYCYEMVYEGYNDWYLPAKDELNTLYAQKVAVGGFTTSIYWSSSESTVTNAWYQNFNAGNQNDDGKSYPNYVRCIRAF
jgi:hypothetical protein